MSNHHLRNPALTLKAKGLLSQMLSLPENWDYTLQGLSCINREKIDAIREAVRELEQAGYITRSRERNDKGQLVGAVYIIREQPSPPTPDSPTLENPIQDKPTQGKPTLEIPMEISIDSSIKDSRNTDLLNIHQSIRAEPPSAGRKPKPDTIDTMDIYRTIIKTNIGYEYLCEQNKTSTDEIDEILELMVEVVCSTRETIRIGGEDKPRELVKSRMLKIDQFHVEYVLESLNKNTTEVRNIKGYLLTAIFNAPNTIGSYYKSRVNHDLYGVK